MATVGYRLMEKLYATKGHFSLLRDCLSKAEMCVILGGDENLANRKVYLDRATSCFRHVLTPADVFDVDVIDGAVVSDYAVLVVGRLFPTRDIATFYVTKE